MTKPILLGTLGLGMLLGVGGTLLSVRMLDSQGPVASDPASKKERKEKKKQSSGNSQISLSPEEASNELGSWLDRVGTDEDFSYVKQLVTRAAEWSPESTMEQAMLIEDPYKRRAALERLFNYWIRDDQEAAMKALGAIDNVALRKDLYSGAMKWLATVDPIAAVQLLKKTNNLHDYELWSRSFSNWAKKDQGEAIKGVLAIEHASMRRYVLKNVAEKLAAANLGKALEWAETLEGDNAQVALAGILSEAAGSNPQTVVEHLEELPEGRMRNQIIERAADEWAERDPGAAIEWAETLGEDEREMALGEIAETVLETDPDRAEEILALIPDSEQRDEVLERIARLRATVDVESAIEWLGSLPAEDRSEAWSGTAREWARVDPQAAAEYASATEDPVAHQQLVAAVSYSWSQRDPASAAEWAQTLEGRTQTNAMNRIVENWTREDPAAAGEFVATSLDGDLQSSMARQVVSRWLRNDTAEASAWVDTLPSGQTRDGAVYTLVQSIESEFPETAMQWANTISNEKRREHAVRRIEQRLQGTN